MVRCLVEPDELSVRVYKDWYARAKDEIQARYPGHWRMFVKILAATSPRVSVKKNWTCACRILDAWMKGKDWTCHVAMRTHIPNVKRALANQALSGDKVSRFARNLLGDKDCVTVDVWIARAYGQDPGNFDYQEIEAKIRQEAKDHGIEPAEWQAVVWQVIRQAEGKSAKNFAKDRQLCLAFA